MNRFEGSSYLMEIPACQRFDWCWRPMLEEKVTLRGLMGSCDDDDDTHARGGVCVGWLDAEAGLLTSDSHLGR